MSSVSLISSFLTCVHQHVALEKIVFAEASGAERASVRPGSIVDEHVTLEISRSRETFVTYCTLVRFVLNRG